MILRAVLLSPVPGIHPDLTGGHHQLATGEHDAILIQIAGLAFTDRTVTIFTGHGINVRIGTADLPTFTTVKGVCGEDEILVGLAVAVIVETVAEFLTVMGDSALVFAAIARLKIEIEAVLRTGFLLASSVAETQELLGRGLADLSTLDAVFRVILGINAHAIAIGETLGTLE